MYPTNSPIYQKAFRHYLRRGTPLEYSIKALETQAQHTTPYYIWRTQEDEKVRESHVANNGRIFSWDNPPATGHPGTEINCRCYAEPYYGITHEPGLDPVYPELIFLPLFRLGRIIGAIVRIIRTIGTDTLTTAQARNLNRFDQKLPKDAGEITIIKGENGQRIFRADVPARNIPGSFARYEKVVDRAGNTVSYTKTTYGPNGEVISIKVKYGE